MSITPARLNDPAAWIWTDLGESRCSLRCIDAELFAAIDAGVIAWPTETDVAETYGYFAATFVDCGDDTTEAIYRTQSRDEAVASHGA